MGEGASFIKSIIDCCTLFFLYLPYVYKKINFVSCQLVCFALCRSINHHQAFFFFGPHNLQSQLIMSSTLGSQCLVLATAMAVSAGTIILFDLVRDKYFPVTHLSRDQDFSSPNQILRSCLSSGDKKGKNKKKKTKRVQFAADVKDPSGNGEEYRREHRKSPRVRRNCCGTEVLDSPALPANRAALYNGILKDRLQRTAYSY